jgi:hypothetical protein
MCCIDGQENKYSVLNECSRMLNYNIFNLGCLHPVARVISDDVGFNPSTQRLKPTSSASHWTVPFTSEAVGVSPVTAIRT